MHTYFRIARIVGSSFKQAIIQQTGFLSAGIEQASFNQTGFVGASIEQASIE